MTVKETQTQGSEGTSACMAAQSARVPLNGISATSLANDDGKTKFYTGLPMPKGTLFELLSSHVSPSRTKLTLRDELVLVLVKLRLNLPFQYFAYRWEVSISTVTRMFYKWIKVMFVRMKFLIKWPPRDILQQNLPQAFKDTYCIAGNFCENPVSPPEEIFAVLILALCELLTTPLYRRRANRGRKMSRGKG